MRRALPLVLSGVVAAAALAGCGGGGGETTTAVPDKAADVRTLNEVLTREMAVIHAYSQVLPKLRGADLAMARTFRTQEQEHVDAIVKALRGLGGEAEPGEEEIESAGLRTRDDVLGFLYGVENVSIAADLRAISDLTSSWPPALLGSIAADQAQRLALLRRALGATVAESIPDAFEDGMTPPPSAKMGE